MYTGYKEIQLTDEELAEFYTDSNKFTEGLLENQYYIIKDKNDVPIDTYIYQKGKLNPLKNITISNQWDKKIKPRNVYQHLAMNLLKDEQSKVKLIRGVYGSGKDHLMLNQALEYIEKGKFQKIVFIRPNVTVAGVPDIGYLKGDLGDKLGWTLGPFYDKVGGEEGVQRLIDQGTLELVPLLFMRGRSFENSIIYVCEAQNTTAEVMKLILSRAGEGTEIWINGDNHQTDNKIYEKDNGVKKLIDRLSGHRLFGYVYLPKTERGEVSELATLLDD